MPIKIKIRKNRHYFSPLSFPRARKVPTFHFYFSNGRLVLVLVSAAISRIALRLLSGWAGWAGLGWARAASPRHHKWAESITEAQTTHHWPPPSPSSPRVWFSNNCYRPRATRPWLVSAQWGWILLCSLTGAPRSVPSLALLHLSTADAVLFSWRFWLEEMSLGCCSKCARQ